MFNSPLNNLTNEELVNLVQASAPGDEVIKDAQGILAQRLDGLLNSAIWIACVEMKASRLFDEVQDDLHQQAYVGLFKAVREFRRDRVVKFSTFAYSYIRGYVMDYIRSEYRYQSRTLPEEVLISELSPYDVPAVIEKGETKEEVGAFLSDLSARQLDVCLKLYWDGRSQREIGRCQGVSHKMVGKIVRQIHAKGMKTFGQDTIVG